MRQTDKDYERMFGHPPPPEEARDPDHPDFGKYNTVFTREQMEAASRRLSARIAALEAEEKKVGQSGLANPSPLRKVGLLLLDYWWIIVGLIVGGLHIYRWLQ